MQKNILLGARSARVRRNAPIRRALRAAGRAAFFALIAIGTVSISSARPGTVTVAKSAPGTNAALGIAQMTIKESSGQTVITAVNSAGKTVAKFELVHGSFVQTEFPELRGREVQGRKLYVDVNGQVITWETIGFADTSRMPAFSPGLNAVTTFLADPRVRRVLEKWRIGWAPSPAPRANTLAASLFSYPSAFGTSPRRCSGLVCPIRSGSANNCGGGFVPTASWAIASDYADEDIISQCCPAEPLRLVSPGAFFDVKACPASATDGNTSCGFVNPGPGRCKACPGSRMESDRCTVRPRSAGYENSAGEPLFFIDSCINPGVPPVVTAASIEIWPPNNEMRSITLSELVTAQDGCGNPIDVDLNGNVTSIISNEPGVGQYAMTGESSFRLRAERGSGNGNDRVYEIRFSIAHNSNGATEPGMAFVRVPHDRR